MSLFNDFSEQLARGSHDFDAHVFKVMLTNVAPIAANSVKADITEISAGNGYVAGGLPTTVSISEVSGVTSVRSTQVLFEATGVVGPFRYAVLYNDTQTLPLKPLVQYWDIGTVCTLESGEKLAIRFSSASPGTFLSISPEV
jgi:hypothetical protein